MIETQGKQDKPKATRLNSEMQAQGYMLKLKMHIKRERGQFLRDEDSSFHVILNGQRIPLNYDSSNIALAKLMLDSCGVSTLSAAARATIQRLQVWAGQEAGRMTFRKFSALSRDGNRLYVPLEGRELLLITADGIRHVNNGENEDSFWLEHPSDEPLRYSDESPGAGLELFERLLVETQSCAIPEMKWLVAMNEGLFPYIRDGFPGRFLIVHQGGTQQGKTTGAQRFTLLQGLGQVMGNYTVASLGNAGDTGLLVLDNREQANFKQDLIDFCLFLATGAERARSSTDGRLRKYKYRPVGVITTIEGVYKAELQARCVEVEYAVKYGKSNRAAIEYEIEQQRHLIGSSLMNVLQTYLQLKGQYSSPNPIQNFEQHFTALCDLLRATGHVAGKPDGWAEEIIEKWDEVISNRGEEEEDELEHPILRAIEQYKEEYIFKVDEVNFGGKRGKLYVITCDGLLSLLQRLRFYDRQLPVNARGLSRRLHSAKFRAFRFLDGESGRELEQLRRTSNKRPIGFFFEDEERQACDGMTMRDAA
jgi:hypothetical protein